METSLYVLIPDLDRDLFMILEVGHWVTLPGGHLLLVPNP
jgi:hypothetical protein